MKDFPEFCAAAPFAQLAEIRTLSPAEATELHNLYIQYPRARMNTLEALMKRASPAEYSDTDQEDVEIPAALTPQALKAVRDATYKAQIRPLLTAATMAQRLFVEQLDPAERTELKDTVDRYARELGRSHRVRELEALIGEYPCAAKPSFGR